MNEIKIPAIFMAPEVRLCRTNGHIWTNWKPAVVTPRGTTEARYCLSCQSSQTRHVSPEAQATHPYICQSCLTQHAFTHLAVMDADERNGDGNRLCPCGGDVCGCAFCTENAK